LSGHVDVSRPANANHWGRTQRFRPGNQSQYGAHHKSDQAQPSNKRKREQTDERSRSLRPTNSPSASASYAGGSATQYPHPASTAGQPSTARPSQVGMSSLRLHTATSQAQEGANDDKGLRHQSIKRTKGDGLMEALGQIQGRDDTR
jgi:hypothetical protein